MRPIIGERSDFANQSWPATNDSLVDFVATFDSIVIFAPANLFVLYISFFSKSVVGNYKYFIANQAFCDLLLNFAAIFACLFHQICEKFSIPMTVNSCLFDMALRYMPAMCVQLALPLISINRYFVIVKKNDEMFTTKLIVFLCFTTYAPFLWPLIEFVFAPYVSYIYICGLYPMVPFFWESWLLLIAIYIPTTVIFCNYNIYAVLSRHISEVSVHLNKTAEQIREERSILKALILQSTVPLLVTFPVAVCLFFVLFDGWAPITKPVITLSSDAHLNWFDICGNFLGFNAIMDALICLLVVKQYRNGAGMILAKFMKKKTGTTVVTSIHLTHRERAPVV
jgi:hypothetical protein